MTEFKQVPAKSSLSETISLGHVFVSEGVSELLGIINISEYMNRHVYGDWSEMCDFEKKANIEAVKLNGFILSAFKLPQECLDYIKEKQGELISDKIYLETQWDRNSTTISLPYEELVH